MAEIQFDHEQAVQGFRATMEEACHQRTAHCAQVPHYSPSAAGRDFGEHGARIAGLLELLHQRAQWRIDNLEATASAAVAQLDEVAAGDSGNARVLNQYLGAGQ